MLTGKLTIIQTVTSSVSILEAQVQIRRLHMEFVDKELVWVRFSRDITVPLPKFLKLLSTTQYGQYKKFIIYALP